MLTFLETYGRNYKYSQNLEEGILEEALRRMGVVIGKAVEVGGHNGLFLSNTALLAEKGWSVTFVEADYNLYEECRENWKDNPRVRSQCCVVDGNNVNAFVGDSCDVFSSDVDGADYRIFQGLQARPKIVIMEIDSSIPPSDPSFNRDGAAGYFRGVELGIEKGYFLLCHTGNLVFVKEEFKHLFPEVKSKHPLIDSEFYFNRAWIKEEAA